MLHHGWILFRCRKAAYRRQHGSSAFLQKASQRSRVGRRLGRACCPDLGELSIDFEGSWKRYQNPALHFHISANAKIDFDSQKGARTSSLQAPIMLLTGHKGEIYSGKFHPDGTFLATSGFDRQILFWNTFADCENFHMMTGHTGAILDMHFSTGGLFHRFDSGLTKFTWTSNMHSSSI